jgi:hypothetical protein
MSADQSSPLTKAALVSVAEALVRLVDEANAATEDGDRGRTNDALTLVLWDDGSGRVAFVTPETRGSRDSTSIRLYPETWFAFNDTDELVERLSSLGLEIES